ncbi:hypothetical protein [Desulfosporosinus acidiphilus]|uniref:hypothetical protein n=1 Tax=Desulfosporosinus acidiphilus TaxID=885581 RepID=UPI001A9A4BAB|nr:hypothetical protein [Desulfosporosinus acidiphilus]
MLKNRMIRDERAICTGDVGVGGSCMGSASQTSVNRSAPAIQLPQLRGQVEEVFWGDRPFLVGRGALI